VQRLNTDAPGKMGMELMQLLAGGRVHVDICAAPTNLNLGKPSGESLIYL
jgi:hypothetical protein